LSAKSKELEDAYVLRDLIADAIIDFQQKHTGHRVVIDQEYSLDTPARASIGQLSVGIVDRFGSHKATTFKSLQ